jgi:hypothetical protein
LPGTELKFNRHSANTGVLVSTGCEIIWFRANSDGRAYRC